MSTVYEIHVEFKNNKPLDIKALSDVDVRERLSFSKTRKMMRIGQHFITTDEILWLEIRGEKFDEKYLRDKLSGTREKVE